MAVEQVVQQAVQQAVQQVVQEAGNTGRASEGTMVRNYSLIKYTSLVE